MKATTSGIPANAADWRRQRSGRIPLRPAGGTVPETRANEASLPGAGVEKDPMTNHKEGM